MIKRCRNGEFTEYISFPAGEARIAAYSQNLLLQYRGVKQFGCEVANPKQFWNAVNEDTKLGWLFW